MEPVKIQFHPASNEQPSTQNKKDDLIIELDQEEITALKDVKVGTTVQLHGVIDKGYDGSNNPVVQDCTYEANMFELDEFTDPKIIKPMELPKKLSRGTKVTIEVTKQK